VGRHKRLKMEALRELYAALGFENVATYVQSGNVAFDSTLRDPKEIARAIEEELDRTTGYSVSVILRTPAELDRVISQNPFPNESAEDPAKTFVAFLAETPSTDPARLELPAGSRERFVAVEREIYLHCPDGARHSKLTNNFFEKALGVRVTTRNWRTVLALHDLVEKTRGARG